MKAPLWPPSVWISARRWPAKARLSPSPSPLAPPSTSPWQLTARIARLQLLKVRRGKALQQEDEMQGGGRSSWERSPNCHHQPASQSRIPLMWPWQAWMPTLWKWRREEDDNNRSDEENAVPVNYPCVVCKVNSFPPHQVQTARDIIFRKVTHDNLDLGALIRSVLYCDKHVNSVATLIAFDA